ncbi:ribosomal RNA methyltransferase MRM2 [Trichoderma gamsii]|uniref:rRNA methyltransferase 2, mitochondrial n=1 Tax=Trichoderma gamsii TaxID=398673 RepID=A0A2P4Z810_9HYPO|nr:ribosomal RNA methyltransferase MRM2 [Trichoderma gamsii]PON20424.1 ribosomal RNA methyltransferase MRM2 [Trichoderma gamsii]
MPTKSTSKNLVDVRQIAPATINTEILVMLTSIQIVLSDMSAPWEQTSGFSSKTLSNPYDRLMNTSGIASRDHAGSMDLCEAALQFASDTLKPGGHLVCKFYMGARDKELEKQLRLLFAEVHREKPESSRSESREAFFVALRRKSNATVSIDDHN